MERCDRHNKDGRHALSFEISHGYHLRTLNRTFPGRWLLLRAGAGIVLAHTESSVRGLIDNGESGGVFGTG